MLVLGTYYALRQQATPRHILLAHTFGRPLGALPVPLPPALIHNDKTPAGPDTSSGTGAKKG